MRLFDETCLALCEGQYIDIALSASDAPMSVDLYFDMIGRKTAALISASIEAGALLATEDEDVIARYRASAGRSASPSSSTTTCSASGVRSRPRASSRRTSPIASGRCRSSTPSSTPAEDRERLDRLYTLRDPIAGGRSPR